MNSDDEVDYVAVENTTLLVLYQGKAYFEKLEFEILGDLINNV